MSLNFAPDMSLLKKIDPGKDHAPKLMEKQ